MPLPSTDEEKEMMLFTEFYRKQAEAKVSLVLSSDFDLIPEPFNMRMVVSGEICAAWDFDANVVYVQYQLLLPSDWRSDSEKYADGVITQGCTQFSLGMPGSDGKTYYRFGLPLELSLLATCTADSLTKTPKIVLKVVSVDCYDRHQIAGYGYVDLPSVPGAHTIEVATWKPELEVENRLKTYFVGGCPELDDMTYPLLTPVTAPKCLLLVLGRTLNEPVRL